MHVYKFRDCLLNTSERSVIKERQHVELTSKTFDVLEFLIENAGKVVSKDEILGHVWNGNFVEESNLPVHISKLRRSLSESRDCRFIETVQGTGYRFVAPVVSVGNEFWQESLPLVTVDRGSHSKCFDSIAVLPFENETANSEIDYLAEGLTESITNNLSLVPALKVIARNTAFRYKDKAFKAREVGETLGVDAVLVGSIRITETTTILNLELVGIKDGTLLWGKQFAGKTEEIILRHNEISSVVVQKLKSSEFRTGRTSNGQTTRNSESYRLYLKGKYLLEKRTIPCVNQAIEAFSKSVIHDPGNVHSYAELIDCHRFLYVIDGISYQAALTSIAPPLLALSSYDSAVDVVQLVYGELKLQLHWDIREAERHVKKALELNPNFVPAYHRYIEILMILNRFEEALLQIQRVLEIDPLSLLTYKRIGKWLYGMGKYEMACGYLNDALELEPFDYETLAVSGGALTEMGKYDEALLVFNASMESHPTAEILSMIGYVHALSGDLRKVNPIIKKLKRDSSDVERHALKLARIYLALGEVETTFTLLRAALERHEIDLTAITYDPRWKAIKSDHRFIEIIKKMGFPY